jgi:hypothetical protein
MCLFSKENLQALNLVLHPQHMECKPTKIDYFQKRRQIGQNTKLEFFLNQGGAREQKFKMYLLDMQIKILFMLNKSEFDQGTTLNPLVHKESQVLKCTIAIEIQANTPPIQHHHQGAKKYHGCQKDVVGN